MIDSISALKANLDYAVRMVRGGYNTPEQAVQLCGIKLSDLYARLAQSPKTGSSPSSRQFLM